MLRDRQGDLQCIDGIQSQITAEQWSLGIDGASVDVFQIEIFDDQFGQFALGRSLFAHACLCLVNGCPSQTVLHA